MSDLVSYFLVGRCEGKDATWIQSLNVDAVPEELGAGDVAVLKYLCRKAGCVPCCTIRGRRDPEGNIEYWHGYFTNSDTPSPEDELAKSEALLRIATNFDENAARRIADDAAVLTELGGD